MPPRGQKPQYLRNPQPAMGEPFGTAGCAFDLALLSVLPEAGCHQDLHGMLWSFLLWRDATRRAQITTTETSTGKEVNRDCGNANDFVCLCEPTQRLC